MSAAEPSWSDWPELLQRVAECCGAGVALRLARTYGGREIYIPTPEAIDEGHHLAVALGLASARQMADVLRVGKLLVPMGPTSSPKRRAAAIRRMRSEGATNAQIAKTLGIHLRTVEVRQQRDREAGLAARDDDTLDLFDR
ncbi:MAG: helix-turn-helix domain-containing protein [Pseudomonadota bacterium]|nr:helix-turn-helix domain-containing protein [Pseudomonadota bacterium]MED5536492.1 helix-turn-helix domain-containing protein [Pseudomonadota bacterium]